MKRVTVRQVDPPDDDETYDDFMERCTDELTGDYVDDDAAEDACQMMWDERGAKDGGMVTKTTTAANGGEGMEFILSDETPDRIGDIIMADGCDLSNFKRNPIALFGHRSDFPIGQWRNLLIEKTALRGELVIAPEGTSERIDEIRRLINAGVLRAVSVGFRAKDYEVIKDQDDMFVGYKFTKQELLETSLVSVPANPNALAVAKGLSISRATLDLVFAGHGTQGAIVRRRGGTGGQAKHATSNRKGQTMSFAQRIRDAEQRLNGLRDNLRDHLDSFDDTNVSDADMARTKELNGQITQQEQLLITLRDSERHLAATSDSGGRALVVSEHAAPATTGRNTALNRTDNRGEQPRPFGIGRKTVSPLDLLVRSGTIMLFAHRDRKPMDVVRRELYGDDEPTKVVFEWTQRAATAPATSTTTGWAAELVQQVVVDFMALLMPRSVFGPLSVAGLSLTFGRNGRIIIPTRNRTPTVAGSFVGEGAPIPVRQGQFA